MPTKQGDWRLGESIASQCSEISIWRGSTLRNLNSKKYKLEEIWIRRNHDFRTSEFWRNLKLKKPHLEETSSRGDIHVKRSQFPETSIRRDQFEEVSFEGISMWENNNSGNVKTKKAQAAETLVSRNRDLKKSQVGEISVWRNLRSKKYRFEETSTLGDLDWRRHPL